MELLEDAGAVRHRILCLATPGRASPIRLHGFLESSGIAVCDSGHTVRTDPVLSGRLADRVAGATPPERSCRILAQRVMGPNRGGDSVCRTVQSCRRIARPPYGGYRCSLSVSAPGRNPAVDPAIRAASPKSAQTGAVISAPVPIPGYRPDSWYRGMHLTPETPTYSMRGCGGLPADAGGVRGAFCH